MNRRMLLLAVSILCWVAAILPASAQHFQQIPGSLAQIAAGRSEVWGLDPSSGVHRFNSGTKTFAKVGTIKFSRIAVGGGTAFQADQVWGVAASGKVYRYNYTKSAFSLIPGTLSQIVVGEGDFDKCHPYEVWGLDANQLIYRYNYCTLKLDQVSGSLTQIATGGGQVWGLNGAAQIYYYSFEDQTFANIPGSLQLIIVGVNDVWGLDGADNAYTLDGSTLRFINVVGTYTQIAAGGNGVWLVGNNGQTVHFSGIYAFSLPGSFSQIVAGYGAGVWALDSAHHVYAFVRP